MKHHNTGKQYAMQGDKPKESHLHVRLETRKKAGYVKAAQKAGLKLSAWIEQTLDKEIEKIND